MSPRSRREVLASIYPRYRKASRTEKSVILTEFCAATGYHRKYAIELLRRPLSPKPARQRARRLKYSHEAVRLLAKIWEAAGYPWSARLKALLPRWLPWAKRHLRISPEIEAQLRAMSPRTMDRRLRDHKKRLGRRLYGRTKPGTLLKHQIPIQTSAWKTTEPGFGEMDLVSHSGSCASGEYVHTLNFTDIATTWVESCAVMGRGQTGVCKALEDICEDLPFTVQGLDSDNGSEFLNHHLMRFCRERKIQFTRSRPYKKDDNAHIEQKNWTHVRKLLGWDRYDSDDALEAINDLYRKELRLMMNLFQPTVKLVKKVRVGSRLKRVYDSPQTPLDRLLAAKTGDRRKVAELKKLRERLDPFELSRVIDAKLERIYQQANIHHSPKKPAREVA
jgi:hypothetical protein